MELTLQEDFIRQMAEKEEGVSVTAGTLNTEAFYREVERQKAMSQPPESAFTAVLGRFLNLAIGSKWTHNLSFRILPECGTRSKS